ncbi:MAG: PhoU domain-containing protein [Methanomicrobiales archaeon]|nr:PhoU domain-containing protein [Methanomicrobiales archaeon]
MEIRKVQITGGSSFVVSLPKEWARAMNIRKNDPLLVRVQPDGTLLVTPRVSRASEPTVKSIDVDKIGDPKFFLRTLIGAYITGHTVIRITSRSRLAPAFRNMVNEFTQMTIGQEIVDETESSLTLKDLLNPAEMPFESSIRRMYLIVKSMYRDGMTALQNGDMELTKDIVRRDREVDRLHWLIARQFHLLLKEIGLMERMKVSLKVAFEFYIVSRILERVGDHGERIARYIPTLIESRPDERLAQDLKSTNEMAMEILDSAMKALFSGNVLEANGVIEALGTLEERADGISDRALQKKGAIALSIGYIVESVRRAGEYGADIAENVINHAIDEA